MSEAILTYDLHNRGEYSIIVNKRSRSNSLAMPIHKLPDCADWLTNIRVFRQLISCRASAL